MCFLLQCMVSPQLPKLHYLKLIFIIFTELCSSNQLLYCMGYSHNNECCHLIIPSSLYIHINSYIHPR